MSEIEMFQIGQRVRLTAAGREAGLQGNRETAMGTVRGLGSQRGRIRVQPDGIRSTYTYHPSFWESAEGERSPK